MDELKGRARGEVFPCDWLLEKMHQRGINLYVTAVRESDSATLKAELDRRGQLMPPLETMKAALSAAGHQVGKRGASGRFEREGK